MCVSLTERAIREEKTQQGRRLFLLHLSYFLMTEMMGCSVKPCQRFDPPAQQLRAYSDSCFSLVGIKRMIHQQKRCALLA